MQSGKVSNGPLVWANGILAAYLNMSHSSDVEIVFVSLVPPHVELVRKSLNTVVETAAKREGELSIAGVAVSWHECADIDEKAWPILIRKFQIFPTELVLKQKLKQEK